jgi:tetratricopeptide (TPR) repeat protein
LFCVPVTYLQKEDYNRAIAELTQAIRLDQNYADAYSNRGNVYFAKCKNDWGWIISTADYDRALADYTQAIRLDVSSAWRYAARGNAYLASGNYNRYRDNNRAISDYNYAILDFDQAIKLGPTAWRYTERGEAYLGKEDYDKAIADFSKSIELEPATWRYNLLGNAYLRKGDYTNAVRIYSNDTKMYRIRFGGIWEDEKDRYDILRELGFNLYYEGSESDYPSPRGRVLGPIIYGIRGTDVTITFQKIFAAGFLNFWVREEN